MFEQVEVNSERWFDLKLLMNEEFRDVINYEGLYQVSNYGRIKSLDKVVDTNNQYYKKSKKILKGKILKQRILRKYYCVGLTKNKKQKTNFVHRLVAQAFISNPNNLPCVNHKDGNKKNNKAENLEFVTHKENSLHSIYVLNNKKPPIHKGESNKFSKHSKKEIDELRKKRNLGYTLKQLSIEYGYTITHISNICTYKSWK